MNGLSRVRTMQIPAHKAKEEQSDMKSIHHHRAASTLICFLVRTILALALTALQCYPQSIYEPYTPSPVRRALPGARTERTAPHALTSRERWTVRIRSDGAGRERRCG